MLQARFFGCFFLVLRLICSHALVDSVQLCIKCYELFFLLGEDLTLLLSLTFKTLLLRRIVPECFQGFLTFIQALLIRLRAIGEEPTLPWIRRRGTPCQGEQ